MPRRQTKSKKISYQKEYSSDTNITIDNSDAALNKSHDINHILTNEACHQRLELVELEKKKLEDHVAHIASESRVRLEASLEGLKLGLELSIKDLSDKLTDLYMPDSALPNRAKREIGHYGRKVFTPAESTLSKMLHYEDENYKTIFNIMICVLLLWGLSLAFDDLDRSGLPNFDLLFWGIFRDLEPFWKSWLLMFTSSFSIIFLSHFAAEATSTWTKSVMILVYTLLQMGACYYSAWIVNSREVPFAMPLAVGFMAEQARISMKMHSYFREKLLFRRYNGKFAVAPRSIRKLPLLGLALPEANYIFAEMEKFFYFMFVPTLVYRDAYPRTIRIRWSFVLVRLLEAVSIVYYAFLIFRQVLPQFRENVGEPISTKTFVKATFSCM